MQANHFISGTSTKFMAFGTEPPLDLSLNRRTLAGMKGHFATLSSATSAITLLAANASAHPGHSPTDIAAQLSAPAAGADHLAIFAVVSALAVLIATRVAVYLIQRRDSRRMRRATRR
jgi:hypothetical protein